jgi:hypothetical protein
MIPRTPNVMCLIVIVCFILSVLFSLLWVQWTNPLFKSLVSLCEIVLIGVVVTLCYRRIV